MLMQFDVLKEKHFCTTQNLILNKKKIIYAIKSLIMPNFVPES